MRKRMRELIFRGKLHNDGRWIAWSLLGAIFADKSIEVDFETVGQYTGLTDKNGKKIFEGDIVKVTDDNGETDLCSCGVGEVCLYDGVWYIGDEVNDGLYDVSKIYYIEIIGNIHDNPELLKGE